VSHEGWSNSSIYDTNDAVLMFGFDLLLENIVSYVRLKDGTNENRGMDNRSGLRNEFIAKLRHQ